MKIEKKVVKRPFRKLIKQGLYEDIDTGDCRERKVIKADGEVVTEKVAITRRVYHEPVFEDTFVDVEVHVVKTHNGKTEEDHEFANNEDAQRYVEHATGVRK